MNNLPNDLKRFLDNTFSISLLKVNESYLSEDGTRKWLFKLRDGKEIETVFIPEGKRGTICVSSQVDISCPAPFVLGNYELRKPYFRRDTWTSYYS